MIILAVQTKQKKNKAGRPTKLNEAMKNKICSFIRNGNYVETAAAAAGINKSTLYDWLKKGANQKTGIYKQFSDEVAQAVAESEIKDLGMIQEAAKNGNWQAAAWRLERRFNSKWGRKEKISADIQSEHTEKEELIIERRLTADEESRELLRQLFRRKAALEREGK